MRPFWKSLRGVMVVLVVCTLAACGKLDSPGTKAAIEVPGVVPVAPASDNIFTVAVGTIWESDGTNKVYKQGSCSFPNDGSTTQTCTVTVPESQLFFSKLKIDASVQAKDKCDVLEFHPYYFLMSSSAAFKPSWADSDFSAIDCTKYATTAGCWGGPATTLASLNFPSNTHHYYPTSFFPDISLTFDSTNSVRSTRKYNGLNLGNRWTVNDLSNKADLIIGKYAGQTGISDVITYQDWQFVCVDLFGETKYTLTLYLKDSNSTRDDYPTWAP